MSWPEIIAQLLPFAHLSLLAYDWFFSMFWLRDFCRDLACLVVWLCFRRVSASFALSVLAENSTECCSFLSLGFLGRDGVCLFGFVLSLGIFYLLSF